MLNKRKGFDLSLSKRALIIAVVDVLSICIAFFACARQMQRMAAMKRIIFADNAADLHNSLLQVGRFADKILFKTSKMMYNHLVSLCKEGFFVLLRLL